MVNLCVFSLRLLVQIYRKMESDEAYELNSIVAHYSEILEYWFGDYDRKSPLDKASSTKLLQRWFAFGLSEDERNKLDAEIRRLFLNTVIAAAEGKLEDWSDARGMLALILLLDQFPRNIYRYTGEAFVYDKISLCLAKSLITSEKYNDLEFYEK